MKTQQTRRASELARTILGQSWLEHVGGIAFLSGLLLYGVLVFTTSEVV